MRQRASLRHINIACAYIGASLFRLQMQLLINMHVHLDYVAKHCQRCVRAVSKYQAKGEKLLLCRYKEVINELLRESQVDSGIKFRQNKDRKIHAVEGAC